MDKVILWIYTFKSFMITFLKQVRLLWMKYGYENPSAVKDYKPY